MIGKNVLNGRAWIILAVVVIIAGILFLSKEVDKTVLVIDHVTVEKIEDIKPIDDSLVVPVLYNDVNLLTTLRTDLRKTRFIDIILPAVLIYRHNLSLQQKRVESLKEKASYSIKWSANDSLFMTDLYSKYKTKNFEELLKRMTPHPISLTLAQAAVESGWGSSRFFKDGNNVFGIWSFNRSDERMIASQSRDGKSIYLRKYDDLLGSVEDYHLILARNSQYSEFRDCVHRENNVFELIWYLRAYSERKDQYVIMLRNIIVANHMIKYDNYRLDPNFFDYPTDEASLL